MREQLAETLLRQVMEWGDEDVARERPTLQALADYKYDGYEQYNPGMRFIESLARWLGQFPTLNERHKAYLFFREHLIYISRAEMHHLVANSYLDAVRPRLLSRAAADEGVRPYLIGSIESSLAFRIRQRSCLFVGLSDGARTDVLRRANPVLSNEQVLADYHGLPNQADELLEELRDELKAWGADGADEARFSSMVLLDDFSASGLSYLRSEGGARKGKISKIAKLLAKVPELVSTDDLDVTVLLYIASERALEHLESELPRLAESIPGHWRIAHIQKLGPESVTRRGDDPAVDALVDLTYSDVIHDRHMKKGGTDGRYGFADCGLSVALAHNTPNNSLAMLWADVGQAKALFPRVTRHREES
jgi:hypothetical protein